MSYVNAPKSGLIVLTCLKIHMAQNRAMGNQFVNVPKDVLTLFLEEQGHAPPRPPPRGPDGWFCVLIYTTRKSALLSARPEPITANF